MKEQIRVEELNAGLLLHFHVLHIGRATILDVLRAAAFPQFGRFAHKNRARKFADEFVYVFDLSSGEFFNFPAFV